jgi:hypothetical protein
MIDDDMGYDEPIISVKKYVAIFFACHLLLISLYQLALIFLNLDLANGLFTTVVSAIFTGMFFKRDNDRLPDYIERTRLSHGCTLVGLLSTVVFFVPVIWTYMSSVTFIFFVYLFIGIVVVYFLYYFLLNFLFGWFLKQIS